MKALSGKVVSSNPISLSKAAKIMSGFAAVDNGASDAVRIFLRRTSDAFHSLGLLHKEFKNPVSHRMLNGSQPIDSEVKTESLAGTLENPEEKIAQKHSKKRDREASQLVTVKTEGKKDLNHEFASTNEDEVAIIDQGSHGVSGKKRSKKDKAERKQNEERLKVLDERVKKEKVEHNGSAEVRVKKEKKRKRIEGNEQGKSSEVEDVKKENVMDADGLESAGVEKQDGKKKRKKMKTERID